MIKTKVVCTLGPSTEDDKVLRALMIEGMNVARFNFSHGDYAQHEKNMKRVKALRSELGYPIATLLDTKGPEIRIGQFEKDPIQLQEGQIFTLTTEDIIGNQEKVSISYKNLIEDIQVGSKILIDDGLIELKVKHLTENEIACEVINGGMISSRKGVNVPNVHLSIPFISEKDKADILFGMEQGFDFIAASFTRCAEDILQIRKLLSEYNCNTINIIAKIENMQGVENIDEIIRVADGIMVARGDMGVEIPFQDVPVIQKMMIKKVCNADKQVITATQMLDSMIKNPRPTRAEATDVANAIYDGTSAIMLSGETAAGKYPVETLKTMVSIAGRAEQDIDYEERFRKRENTDNKDVTNAISHATCTTAMDLNAAAIVTVTKSGKTARMISKYRPASPIIGCSPDEHVCRQMGLTWGVIPLLVEEEKSTDHLFEHSVRAAERAGYVKPGELVVITAGIPLAISGTTNMIKVHVVGDILVTGQSLIKKKVCGCLCVCKTEEEVRQNFKSGDILVIPQTSNGIMEELKQAAGIIVEQEGINSHAAIVSLSLDIPVILGASNATDILKTGAIIILDGEKGVVACSE